MHRQTAADALIDAGRDVVTAIGSERDRSREGGASDPTGTLVVGTLLLLAAAAAPILAVGLVGYVVTAARDPDNRISGSDAWIAIGAAGVRGTGVLVGAALPLAAALGASGLVGVEAGSVTLGTAPGPLLATGIGALAVATWHAAAVGTAAIAADGDWNAIENVRFARSAAGLRLSGALAGLGAGVGVVGIGLTAIPVVGPVVAAGVGAVGVVVAARLVGRTVDNWDLQSGSAGWDPSEDRLAAPTDGPGEIQRGNANGETVQHNNRAERGPAQPTTTPRGPRRGRP